MSERVAAIIILAGGTAARLGGVSKPDFKVGGRRLIDILFDQLDAIGFAGEAIVVAPADVAVRPGVVLTLEDPPHGGPLAGIGAGVRALTINDDDLVAIATCDAPVAVRLLPQMASVLNGGLTNDGLTNDGLANDGPSDARRPDGVVPLNVRDWPQYAHGLYRAGALRSLAFERDGSVRRAFCGLDLATVRDDAGHCIDVDTPEDAQALLAHLTHVENPDNFGSSA